MLEVFTEWLNTGKPKFIILFSNLDNISVITLSYKSIEIRIAICCAYIAQIIKKLNSISRAEIKCPCKYYGRVQKVRIVNLWLFQAWGLIRHNAWWRGSISKFGILCCQSVFGLLHTAFYVCTPCAKTLQSYLLLLSWDKSVDAPVVKQYSTLANWSNKWIAPFIWSFRVAMRKLKEAAAVVRQKWFARTKSLSEQYKHTFALNNFGLFYIYFLIDDLTVHILKT